MFLWLVGAEGFEPPTLCSQTVIPDSSVDCCGFLSCSKQAGLALFRDPFDDYLFMPISNQSPHNFPTVDSGAAAMSGGPFKAIKAQAQPLCSGPGWMAKSRIC